MLPRTLITKIIVCKSNIPAGINYPPPSKTISRVTRVQDHLNTLSGGTTELLLVPDEGPCETVSFIYDRISSGEELGISPRSEESPLEGQLE